MILYCKDSLSCIDNNNIELINNSRRSVLIICPQGQYWYLPSNIHFQYLRSGVKHYMSKNKEKDL
jgi:hypothetical protein